MSDRVLTVLAIVLVVCLGLPSGVQAGPLPCCVGARARGGDTGASGEGAGIGVAACKAGESACHGVEACRANAGGVRKLAPIGFKACFGDQGAVGEAACIGESACRSNTKQVGTLGCRGDQACLVRQGDAAGACVGDPDPVTGRGVCDPSPS